MPRSARQPPLGHGGGRRLERGHYNPSGIFED
jgi:hypothetical protein